MMLMNYLILLMTAAASAEPTFTQCFVLENINTTEETFSTLKEDFDECSKATACGNHTMDRVFDNLQAVKLIVTCTPVTVNDAVLTPTASGPTTSPAVGASGTMAIGVGDTVVLILVCCLAFCCLACCCGGKISPEFKCMNCK